jgi:hypothetical protein
MSYPTNWSSAASNVETCAPQITEDWSRIRLQDDSSNDFRCHLAPQNRLRGGRPREGPLRMMSTTFEIREEPTMSTINISANQLQPGDVVSYGGHWHRVTNVVRRAGASWPVAMDGTGWAIALGDRPLSVRRG